MTPTMPTPILCASESSGAGSVGAAEVASEEARFEAIYDEYVDFAWRSARRLGVSEGFADDVVQQVFLVVYRRLPDFEHRSSYKTWIFSILLKMVSDHRRSLRRKTPHWFQLGQTVEPDALVTSAPGPSEALERADAARTVEALLETLEDDKRTVFVLAELEQMTATEIAEATGMTTAAVYSRLRAARTDFERAAARMRRDETLAPRRLR